MREFHAWLDAGDLVDTQRHLPSQAMYRREAQREAVCNILVDLNTVLHPMIVRAGGA
jgi:hypothetical protein